MITILKRNYSLICRICLSFLLFLVVVWNLSKLNQICVINDEFGYWGTAAYFSGYDWTGLSGTSPYYGYGLGFLYMFLFRVFSDPTIMYKAAIILNALMLITAFHISVTCFKKMFPDIPEFFRVLFCFLIALYPNNIVQSQITWTETLLYLWFWICFYMAIKISEKRSVIKFIFLAIWLIYGLMIHQRTLGVVCSAVIFVTVLWIGKRINWKYVLCFFIPFAITALIFVFTKKYLDSNFWNTISEHLSSANNIEGQVSKVSSLFSAEGMKTFLFSVCGKAFYLILSTLFIILAYLLSTGKNIINCLSVFMTRKKPLFSVESFPRFFLLLSFGSTFLISVIFMLFLNSRGDAFLYGRYNEFVIGPILLLGLGAIYKSAKKWKMFAWFTGLTTCIAFIVNYVLNHYEFEAFHVTNCVGIGTHFSDIAQIGSSAYAILIKTLIIAFFVLILIGNKYAGKVTYALGALLIVWSLWYPAIEYNNQNTYELQTIFSENITDVADIIEQTDIDFPVYYVADDRNETEYENDIYERHIKYVQFYLYDKTVQIHPFTALKNQDAYYIVRRESSCYGEMYDLYTPVYENSFYGIFVKSDGALRPSVEKYVNSLFE